MKKLNVAIIGQGRSGKNIHGKYFLSEDNSYYEVKYVVDADERRRRISEQRYPGCRTFATFEELYGLEDIDLVVNATYSEDHYPVTRELLLHGFNVLCEKPFGATEAQAMELIAIAEEKGVKLAAFQQTFYAPFFADAYRLVKSGKLGQIKQINITYNGLARRWDWQTLQKKCAGSVYNTGPHPIGMALGFLDFDEGAHLAYSRLGLALTSGDAEDYAKLIITAPGKAVVDVEISAMDPYSPYLLKIQGTLGTARYKTGECDMVYIVEGENPERPVQPTFLKNEEGEPIYCSEELIKHEEQYTFEGTAFDVGTARLYAELYELITEGKPMHVTPLMAARIVGIIEQSHKENPLPVKY